MKYIVFWEYCPSDTDKVVEKSLKQQKIAEKHPDKFGTYLFPPHHMGHYKGFGIVEATSEQMINAYSYWGPELQLKFVPINDASKRTESYLKGKK